MKEPPIQLRKPEALQIGDKSIPEHEIAAIHQSLGIGQSYLVILNNLTHHGASHDIERTHPAYQDICDLYAYRAFVWVEQQPESVTFYAHDASALHVLLEQLEREHYAFACSLGGKRHSITVYRNQGEDLDALDREMEIDTLIEDFATPLDKEEEKGKHP